MTPHAHALTDLQPNRRHCPRRAGATARAPLSPPEPRAVREAGLDAGSAPAPYESADRSARTVRARVHRVHGDDGSSHTSVLIALSGLGVLVVVSLAEIAFMVGHRLAGLDIGWRPSPTGVWVLAGTTTAVLVGSAVLALIMFPGLRAHRRRR
jgi:hypothetical protein